MSKAYRCDRCGTYYTYDDFDAEYMIKHPREEKPGYDYVYLAAKVKNPIKVDLCPKCTKAINKWLNTKGEKE